MSDSRYEDVAVSTDGTLWWAKLGQRLRYLEIDRSDAPSSGGVLLVTFSQVLPTVPCNPDDPQIYAAVDLMVRDQERVVHDLGEDDWTGELRIIESQGKPFHARISTDIEPMGNHREGIGAAELVNSSVVAFAPPITNLHPAELHIDGTTAVQIPLIAGNGLVVENNHATATLWIGDDNTVTDGNGVKPGFPLRPGGRKTGFDVGELTPSAQKWAIYDATTPATAVFIARPGV